MPSVIGFLGGGLVLAGWKGRKEGCSRKPSSFGGVGGLIWGFYIRAR